MVSRRSKTFALDLAGELTIRGIGNVRTQIIDALEKHPAVTAKVASDAQVDLTFVQLMESARRSAREAGKSLALAAPAQGGLLETLERGGFLNAADGERREFWLMEAGDR